MKVRLTGYLLVAFGMAVAVYMDSRVLAVSVLVIGAAVIVGGRVYVIHKYGPRT